MRCVVAVQRGRAGPGRGLGSPHRARHPRDL